jgi:hypothetical protein
MLCPRILAEFQKKVGTVSAVTDENFFKKILAKFL